MFEKEKWQMFGDLAHNFLKYKTLKEIRMK